MPVKKDEKEKGFTLIEAVITVVILGILASLAIANFSKMREHAIGKQAEADLIALYNAEKKYWLDSSPASFFYSNNTGQINDTLGVELHDLHFNYSIVPGEDNTGFTATAVRKGKTGLCAGKKMSITEEGGEINKGCSVWK